jgi:hypothetical protein
MGELQPGNGQGQRRPKPATKGITLDSSQREVVTRAIAAAARCLGASNPLFVEAVRWCLDHAKYLDAMYGAGTLLGDCMRRVLLGGSRDDCILEAMDRHGLTEDDFDSVRRAFYRAWKQRPAGQTPEDEHDQAGHFMDDILTHLEKPPRDEQHREIYEANGVLLEWYV